MPLVRQGQIFLDSFNPILENAIKPRLSDGKREPCELKVSDFDDAMYTLEVSTLRRLPCAWHTVDESPCLNKSLLFLHDLPVTAYAKLKEKKNAFSCNR